MTLLHSDSGDDNNKTTQPAEVKSTKETTVSKVVSNRAHVYFAVEDGSKTSMPVYISYSDSPEHRELIYAMLNQQSKISFLLDSVHKRLGLTGSEPELSLSTISSINQNSSTTKVMNLQIHSYTSNKRINLLTKFIKSAIQVNRDHIPTTDTLKQWPYLHEIADKVSPLLDIDVGILKGYDCTAALGPVNRIQAQENGPFALETVLGWGIGGGTDSFVTCHRVIIDHGTAIIAHILKEIELLSPGNISRLLNQDFTCVESDDAKQSVEDQWFMDILQTGIQGLVKNTYKFWYHSSRRITLCQTTKKWQYGG